MALPESSTVADTYGGPYANQRPTEDSSTEMDAGYGNQELCDVAMMTHTSPRAIVLFTGTTYTSGTVSVVPNDHEAMWGAGIGVAPTVGETSAGVYVITWPATVEDELGVEHTLNIRFPDCAAYGVSTLVAKVISWTSNTVTINSYSSGSLNALNGTKIKVWWT